MKNEVKKTTKNKQQKKKKSFYSPLEDIFINFI